MKNLETVLHGVELKILKPENFAGSVEQNFNSYALNAVQKIFPMINSAANVETAWQS